MVFVISESRELRAPELYIYYSLSWLSQNKLFIETNVTFTIFLRFLYEFWRSYATFFIGIRVNIVKGVHSIEVL